jgi:hypothetical protein
MPPPGPSTQRSHESVEAGWSHESSQALKSSPLLIIAQLDVMKVELYVPKSTFCTFTRAKCKVRVDAYDHVFVVKLIRSRNVDL